MAQDGTEEYAWTNRRAHNIRVPAWKACGLASVYAPIYPADQFTNPPKTKYVFDVHCYYKPDGELVRIQCQYDNGSVVAAYSEYYGNFSWNSCGGANQWPTVDHPLNPYAIPAAHLKTWRSWASHTAYENRILGIPTPLYVKQKTGHLSTETIVSIDEDFGGGLSGQESMFGKLVRLKKEGRRIVEGSTGYYFSLVIPHFEREGVILYEENSITGDTEAVLTCQALWGTEFLHRSAPQVRWAYGTREDCINDPKYSATATGYGIQSLSGYYIPAVQSEGAGTGNIYKTSYEGPVTCDGTVWQTYSRDGTAAIGAEFSSIIVSDFEDTAAVGAAAHYSSGTESIDNPADWTLFVQGGIADELTSCLGASPIWVGMWRDAFTQNGYMSYWPKAHISTDKDALRVLGTIPGEWAEANLPIIGRQMSWFGVPMPNAAPDFSAFRYVT
jgi:hypothetical protein